jgi:hypothetical protein
VNGISLHAAEGGGSSDASKGVIIATPFQFTLARCNMGLKVEMFQNKYEIDTVRVRQARVHRGREPLPSTWETCSAGVPVQTLQT